MAVTENTYTGNGSTTNYSFTFPYLEETDVKVSLNGNDQSTSTYSFANATTISFNTAPANGVAIRIYRSTDQDSPPATFFAGSAIRAQDLNENFLQQLYIAQETANATIIASTGNLAENSITGFELADNSVSTNILVNSSVTTAKLDDSSVTSAKIADGTIVNADVNASAAIDGTKVSPDFGSQNIVTTGDVSGDNITATGDATIGSLNGGPLSGTRNRIINGDMRIAQRGTSFAAITNATYSLDRWVWQQTGAMVCTVTQDTDVPNNTFQSSYKVDVTTADTSIAAGDFAFVAQSIEGYNVRDLIGTTFTVSFWVKSPKTGTHCVSFRNAGPPDRCYVKEYTVSAANTWEYKTLTVSGGLITAGNWDWTNGVGLNICFILASGTTFQTTADAWQTGNFIATANQVNVMDSTANDFYLTGVQLEPGTVATPFERRSYGQELALCSRYCQVLNHAGIFNGSSGTAFVATKWSTTDFIIINVPLVCQMRVAPSITQSSATNRYVSNVGTVLSSLGAATCLSKGPITLAFTNNAAAASFGWVDDIGIITASSEL